MQTCLGVRCAAVDCGCIRPGGAQDPARGSSEHQLPILATVLAGGDLIFGLDSDTTARLTHTSGDDTVTWDLQTAAETEGEPEAVAVTPATPG